MRAMWSVKTVPNRGAATSSARSSAGRGVVVSRTSKAAAASLAENYVGLPFS